jgi:putative FmdB family regulatory protein
MPIYAYRCEACGFAKDVLQKMSDDPLTVCPECQKPDFKKQVTAAGFQLKGSGWYVTDFRGGANTTSSNSSTASAESTASNTGGSTGMDAASASTNGTSSTNDTKTSSNAVTNSGDNKAA